MLFLMHFGVGLLAFSINTENQPLLKNEPVEFEQQLVQVKTLGKLLTTLNGIYGICLQINKEKGKTSTAKRLEQ